MPKTTQPIVDKTTSATGIDLEVLTPRAMYVLTYEGKICQIRKDEKIINGGFKYIRNIWTDEGSAQNKANRYNKMFKTTHFSYKKLESI